MTAPTVAHAEVVVLGCGGVGSAAAFHLAKRGISVIALEQFSGAHDRGSSHGETRIIRQAYFEHPDYVPLLKRAYTLWNELESLTSQKLFHQVGLLQVGPEEGFVLSGVRASSKQHALPLVELSAADVQRRYPGITVPAGMCGVLEEIAGYLRVEACVTAHQQAALQNGAQIVSDVLVHNFHSKPQGIELETSQGTFTCNKVVITAGPWAPQFLSPLNIPLEIHRKHLYWFGAAEQGPYATAQGFPTFLFDLPWGCFYGFPVIDSLGLKAAEHSSTGKLADPSHDLRLPDIMDQERVQRFLQECLPQVPLQVNRRSVCYYTMSPDEHFLVDHHPHDSRICFAAGLSGHGFKFTSVLGEILADLALQQGTNLPAQFLGIRRFANTSTEKPI